MGDPQGIARRLHYVHDGPDAEDARRDRREPSAHSEQPGVRGGHGRDPDRG